jgi:hypothetical protein
MMPQSSTGRPVLTQIQDAGGPQGEGTPAARVGRRALGRATGRSWLSEPRSLVWLTLAAAALFGGWRKLLFGWRARKAVGRLGAPNVTPEEIGAAAEHGRAGVWELLRIFGSTQSEAQRQAAGAALARLWLLDQLVAEEEQAVIRRGYTVTWNARRRYPRAIAAPIPISVAYEVPFLQEGGQRVEPANLEWSHRVLGARRAALEEFSPWKAGPGRASFTIVPGDFDTNGPHRLALVTRVRTAGLTDSWTIEPPHMPFSFEFDPVLQLDAILALPDAIRDEAVARAIRLEPAVADDDAPASYLSLSDEWALRNPPRLAVALPLPCDLAHKAFVEIEGVPSSIAASQIVLSGQGLAHPKSAESEHAVRLFELGPLSALASASIERPGTRRMRVRLQADPAAGWADPEVRSIWPGHAETNWIEVEIVRR